MTEDMLLYVIMTIKMLWSLCFRCGQCPNLLLSPFSKECQNCHKRIQVRCSCTKPKNTQQNNKTSTKQIAMTDGIYRLE